MGKPSQYYYGCKLLGQIHHTRVRLNCSSLHQHTLLKNSVVNPPCNCGEIEDTKHFL